MLLLGIDFGSIPAWISAVATVVGFAWAISLFFMTRRNERRAAANAVTCYYDHHTQKVVVENESKHSVTSVEVYWEGPKREVAGAPTAIRAGQRIVINSDLQERTSDRVEVQFIDIYGSKWRKTSNGQLEQLT